MPLQYQQHLRLSHPEGHSDAVTVVAFSPNGYSIASGGLDGRVCVWDVHSGKLLYAFSGKSPVLSVVWLDSNEHMVCGMEDGTIASLAISTNLIHLDGFLAHRYPVERLAFNGTYLASGAHKEIKVWIRAAAGSWGLVTVLRAPRRSSYTTACDILATSLHWTSTNLCPLVLLVTYLSHGIVAFDGRTWARIGSTPLPGYMFELFPCPDGCDDSWTGPFCSADASLTRDGRILAVSNMLTGFELFSVKGCVELEPLFSFKQDVSVGPPVPVRFLHGDHALLGGTLHGRVNIWDVYSRRKQALTLGGEASVLAVAAHYDEPRDDFFVATGIFNRGAPSSIILWKTQETRRQHPPSIASRPRARRPIPMWLSHWPTACMLLLITLGVGWYYLQGTVFPYHPSTAVDGASPREDALYRL